MKSRCSHDTRRKITSVRGLHDPARLVLDPCQAMTQLELDMEPLPEGLKILERRARQEMATPKMKLAGLETMKIFTTARLNKEIIRQ